MHCDESTHSVVLALNDAFTGGGTLFYDFDTTLCPGTGDMISFRGDRLKHGGEQVTSGVRYILAVFLYEVNETVQTASAFRQSKRQKVPFTFDFQASS